MPIKELNYKDAAANPFPIAIVVSRFNDEVTSALLKGALERLQALNWPEEKILVVHVPGAVEIPLIAKKVIEGQRYRAVVTLGAVIRGETTHYDYVCQQVSDGCQRLALDTGVPVIFGVLTTENDDQAMARAGGIMGNKGADAVDAAVEMVSLSRTLTA